MMQFIKLHLLPFTIAALLALLTPYFIAFNTESSVDIAVAGIQKRHRGVLANLTKGEQDEIDYLASIKSKNQLTLFGSSEFSGSPFCSYNFLPDSVGIPALGIGHAYHQHLSILCELLAADAHIEESKICIILSLGWFDTEGTNTSAFLEFARPNFLKTIIQNPNIDPSYKQHIGAYVYANASGFEGTSNELEMFKDAYLLSSSNPFLKGKGWLRQHIKKEPVRYSVTYTPELQPFDRKKWEGNMQALSEKAKAAFVSSITNNALYVNDDYYSTYLVEEDGHVKSGNVAPIDLTNNKELEDFKLVVKYLKQKNAKASFVIQPLNPYYYAGLENYQDLVEVLTRELDHNQIPYLNLFVDNKANYQPGVLKDVMHLGDLGWLHINAFLMEQYHEE